MERMQTPWPKETMVDLMKSSGMAGRTVMTTKDKRRYLHSCSRARTEAALLTYKYEKIGEILNVKSVSKTRIMQTRQTTR